MSMEVVEAGRSAAESLMVDSCTVTRTTGGAWSDAAGDYGPETVTTVYSGRCKVQTRDVVVGEAEAGEREFAVVRWEVHLPVDGSGAVTRGDTVEVTAAAFDPAMVGQRFTVAGPHLGTAKTARRLPVEAVV